MKKIVVNKDICIACGACIGQDPEHFDFDSEGYSEAISQENLDSEDLITAIECCPTTAISIQDGDEKDNSETDACACEHCHCEECDCEDCDCEEAECEECDCKECNACD